MSQTLVRQIISKSSGLPETGKTVFARPISADSPAHDYPMPETPSGSGYYVSTVAIPHDTYKIYVDGADFGEEVTVQPGRAIIGSQGDESTVSPKSLDRIINNKVTLSMFVADTSSAPTNDNFVSAINFAITNNKTLVIDYPDFAPTIDTSISGVLILDLNGNTIDFETNGASLTATMLVVKNGTVKLKTGGKTLIGNAKLNVTDVYLSGDTESQVTAVATDSYTGCRGISALGFSRVSGSYDYTVPRVSGGDSAFDVASIVLGDYDTSASGSASGDARRVNLQQTIDEELKRLHYLIGKESSDTPYEGGVLNDTFLSSIISISSKAEILSKSTYKKANNLWLPNTTTWPNGSDSCDLPVITDLQIPKIDSGKVIISASVFGSIEVFNNDSQNHGSTGNVGVKIYKNGGEIYSYLFPVNYGVLHSGGGHDLLSLYRNLNVISPSFDVQSPILSSDIFSINVYWKFDSNEIRIYNSQWMASAEVSFS